MSEYLKDLMVDAQVEKNGQKKVYSPPTLTVLGNACDLTMSADEDGPHTDCVYPDEFGSQDSCS